MDDLDINPQAESTGGRELSDPQDLANIRTRKYFPETFIWEELTTGWVKHVVFFIHSLTITIIFTYQIYNVTHDFHTHTCQMFIYVYAWFYVTISSRYTNTGCVQFSTTLLSTFNNCLYL